VAGQIALNSPGQDVRKAQSYFERNSANQVNVNRADIFDWHEFVAGVRALLLRMLGFVVLWGYLQRDFCGELRIRSGFAFAGDGWRGGELGTKAVESLWKSIEWSAASVGQVAPPMVPYVGWSYASSCN